MFFNRFKNTDFKAGGLIIEPPPLSLTIEKGDNFIAPRKIDHRDLCIETNNQGNTSECTGYSTAGYIEIKHWQKRHFPKQYDASLIYKGAKAIDNFKGNGSWVKYTVQSAINSGMIKGDIKYINNTRQDLKFAILEYWACIGCFIITNEWNRVYVRDGRISDLHGDCHTIGGHAVLICGFDQEGVYIQNSWGPEWGIFGFGLLPWELFDKQFMSGVVIDNMEIL